MNKLISVIVPIYNKEKYIRQCVDSILNQTFSDFELILVDDGSSDDCHFICDEYKNKDERVKVIHKKNGGLVFARKQGFISSTGEYIMCVDADDYLEKDYLLNFKKEIELNHPDIVCADYCSSNNKLNNKISKFENGFYDKNKIISLIFPYLIQSKKATYFPINIWAKAFKRELYSKVQLGVDESISVGEDSCVSIPCIYYADSLSIINDKSYVYRINDDSMTGKRKVFDSNYPHKLYLELIKHININEYDIKEQMYRFVAHQLFSVVRSMFNLDSNYSQIKARIIELLKNPFYDECIRNAEFIGSFKAELMIKLLRKRNIKLLYIVSKIY